MDPYLFEGVVLPERAQIELKFRLKFSHVTSGLSANADVTVVLNQVAVWIDTDQEWNIFDLRNVVRHLLLCELAIVGYLEGHVYDLDIRRVVNRQLGIDYVFGIEVPSIVERNKLLDKQAKALSIREKTKGPEGVLLRRCFADLALAMKSPEDTGFYCYRAIESLRQHCVLKYNLPAEKRSEQWQKLRELAHCEESTLLEIKSTADPVRHGNVMSLTSQDRDKLFHHTWAIVDAYLEST